MFFQATYFCLSLSENEFWTMDVHLKPDGDEHESLLRMRRYDIENHFKITFQKMREALKRTRFVVEKLSSIHSTFKMMNFVCDL